MENFLYLLILIQIIILFSKSNAIQGYFDKTKYISFKQFYSVELFNQIKNEIEKPLDSFKVASIGMEPMVAQYNGFHTLDGYYTDYSKSYKQDFRKIIAKELDKSSHWRKYFDSWGARCYLFVSELDYIGKDYRLHYHSIQKDSKINNLELDIEAFKKLGGQYIFSNIEISNYKNNGLVFLKSLKKKIHLTIFIYILLNK